MDYRINYPLSLSYDKSSYNTHPLPYCLKKAEDIFMVRLGTGEAFSAPEYRRFCFHHNSLKSLFECLGIHD